MKKYVIMCKLQKLAPYLIISFIARITNLPQDCPKNRWLGWPGSILYRTLSCPSASGTSQALARGCALPGGPGALVGAMFTIIGMPTFTSSTAVCAPFESHSCISEGKPVGFTNMHTLFLREILFCFVPKTPHRSTNVACPPTD